ncbi:outer membrane lipoprotein carrier protein LolA [Acidithiobacillus ferrooxidans]|uniref:LolA family protein n=1 Tax=Acidithiobacillus ferrooxidans TaxID=920 RepID=UPI001EF1C734|nr:outer membrane lipoprotein carrier protein LolA [Acidithiobacillus ferrooxidans]MCR2831518.1 outer membrane lipoprotein carrier protein LolA [Acidithiobacillus ferrooxidans]
MAISKVLRQLLDTRIGILVAHLKKDFLKDQATSPGTPPLAAASGQTSFHSGAVILLMLLGISTMLTAAAAQASEWNIDHLMQSLAHTKPGRATFVEKKFLTILEKPIESSGRLRFIAPDGLEMHTIKPKNEVMLIQGDVLTIDHQDIHLQDHPELLAFIDSIRGTLTGNQQMLKQFFRLSLSGSEGNWTLTMLPRQKKLADLVQYIQVNGSNDTVTSIETLKTNRDRSLITITKSPTP